MEMQILNALVDLVKQGGAMALWGIGIYLTVQLAKVVVIWGLTTVMVRILSEAFFKVMGLRLLIRKDSISLISSKASEHITTALTEWSDKVTAVVQELEKKLSDLKKNSEQKQETKTV